jgi:uncharacterized OB-fold protein
MTAAFSPMEDPETAPFFEAARRGELRIQACTNCGRLRFPPRPMCPWCHSLDSEWQRQSGRGRIWSFAVPHPPLLPTFAEDAPYVVAVIELDEDPLIRLVGNIVREVDGSIGAVPSSELSIGAGVTAVFGKSIEGFPVPQWVMSAN